MNTPTGGGHFDLVVIGAGSGVGVLDERFDGLKVAIVDKGVGPLRKYAGTCLNVGCVPTKMLVHTADTARAAQHGAHLGVDLELRGVDWTAVMDRLDRHIDPVSSWWLDGHEKRADITVHYEGTARFTGERRLEVETAEGTVELTADQVVVAAGSRPVVPPIPGLAEVGFRTSDDVRIMERLPRRMAVVGGGFVATELAHVFSSLGVEVTVVEMLDQLLAREDAEIAQRFTELAKQQWDVRLGRKMVSARRSDDGIVLNLEGPQGAEEVEVDEVLMAIGRRPNSDLVDAAAGGLATHPDGRIVVDEQQATSVPGVWALGDVSSKWMLKHVANAEAHTVMHNVLHPDDPIATDHRYVPHAVFSSPQIATVGLTEQEATENATPYVVGRANYSDTAYGWAMEDTTGFAKVLADPATGKLLGAHIMGPQAPTLIQPLIQAMSLGQDARSVARGQYWIHPAMPEVVQGALNNLPLD
ncbi:mycothione reductase [Streptomyces sp. Tu102]|uniref:mycothione reductase n=1 Tax=Streptomyces sp. Tu102 TaxID=2838019 RepID=UPI001BDC30D5|nr:mycothione reductase [Streptomyces sp. Tu102]MBT1095454.1 mycothione reductase [Streptomyces sp. Tu102]